MVGAASWDIKDSVREAQQLQPTPGGAPPDHLYMLDSAQLQFLHSTKLACHQGFQRTLVIIKQHFWWPGLSQDTRAFEAACSVCVRSKTSHRPPADLLLPLTIPSCPWSHIALDLVTGIPPLEGNTVILMIVDFSKSVHYVALPQLPSALETAELFVIRVFELHGIPMDIVPDQEPQFASHVWQAFCSSLDAAASLSSGYHSWTNGQTERANQDLEAAF